LSTRSEENAFGGISKHLNKSGWMFEFPRRTNIVETSAGLFFAQKCEKMVKRKMTSGDFVFFKNVGHASNK
jgi:hypothetical protein